MRERILVLLRGHVGDLVLSFPALRELRGARPRAHITVIVNEYLRGALEDCPYVDEVLYGFTYETRGRVERALEVLPLLGQLLGRYDKFLALRNAPRFAPLLGLASGARVRVGYSQPLPYGKFLNRELGPQPKGESGRKLQLHVVEQALGITGSPSYSPIDWMSLEVRENTTRLLTEMNVGRRFAILQVSCNWGCNEWRSEKWATLAERLVHDYGLDVVVTGTDDRHERAKFDDVARRSNVRLISLHGRTSIPALFDIVGRASLVVASDSALTQVALAQRTPSVVLFGIESMKPNGPLPEEEGVLMEPIQHWEGPDRAPQPNPRCVLEGYGERGSYCHGVNCRENSSLVQTEVAEVSKRIRRLRVAQPWRARSVP